jgi:hypothetical protein
MAFVEDFTPFLQDSEFSVNALILATGEQVPVIFDDGYQEALTGAFAASQPTALGTTQALQDLDHGSQLMLPKAAGSLELVAYAVVSNQPDGTGMTRLMLEVLP